MYVKGNPIRYSDPTGHITDGRNKDGPGFTDVPVSENRSTPDQKKYDPKEQAKDQLVKKIDDKTKGDGGKSNPAAADNKGTAEKVSDNCIPISELATKDGIILPIAKKDTYEKTVSSNFGAKVPFRNGVPHSGIDIPAKKGTSIYSTVEGEVTSAKWINGYGNTIIVTDPKTEKQYYYAHDSKFSVKQGDKVKQGQKVAEVGSTGDSTGNHVHFEVRDKNDNVLNPYKEKYKEKSN